jgi:TnpA family transposase
MENSTDLINALIETLIKEYCELPAFSTLERLVRRVKNLVNRRIFADMEAKCTVLDVLDALLEHPENAARTSFNRLKENPPNSTFMHLKELIERFHWLKSIGDVSGCLKDIPESKTRHFIAEAKVLDASEMKDFLPSKRHSLLICLLNHSQTQAADDLLTMFCKRITDIHNSGDNALENFKQKNKEKSERLFALAGKVLQVAKETKSSRAVGIQVLKHIKEMGGIDALFNDYEELELYSGDNALPLLWPLYKSHRSFLFVFLDLFEFKSTSQDGSLVNAIAWIRANRNLRKEMVESDPLLDLSFASAQWQKLVRDKNNPKLLNRRHLEVCVFSCLRDELHSGDICVSGSEEYSDYRERLLSDEECNALLATYCQEMNLPPTAAEFVASLKTLLETTAKKADEDYIENESYELSPKGILILKRRKAPDVPPEAQNLKEAIQKKMPQHSILEILRNAERWTGWTRHFGPTSGSDPKISDPVLRYILTTFTWGCNLGPEQAAKHMGGLVSPHGLSFTNRRHFDVPRIEKASTDLQNFIHTFELTKLWGDGTAVAVDGTKFNMYERNLMAEPHIRYGGWGGIGLNHVANNYIAQLCHFLTCGTWEGIYLFDDYFDSESDIKPRTFYSDTQGQSTPIFALAYLLGADLKPRIRKIKNLVFYRPQKGEYYQHIDALFDNKNAIDWELLQTHWFDLIKVGLSIRMGRIVPSRLLKKLGTYSRKNRLYHVFRELDRVIRTEFLLRYIQDIERREEITAETNKAESYNWFSKWLFFGDGGVISSNDREEQEKSLKYNRLVANAVILQNVADLTKVVAELVKEGYPVTKEALCFTSPYMIDNINRLGTYTLNMNIFEKCPDFTLSL